MQRSRTRREAVLAEIEVGGADVDVLAARFGVSASTIRRDLQELSRRRAVMRTYGGAVPAPAEMSIAEDSLRSRRTLNRAAKAAIAAAALALLRNGERLILDGGSTVEALGRGLRERRHLVITSNLPMITLLAEAPGIDLLVLGGAVRPISMSTTGPLAEQALRQMTADRCFLGADGVVAGRGLCEATLEQVSLKLLMMAQAKELFVLADASKLGRAGQPCWAPIERPWTLITDASATAEQCAPFEQSGTRVIRAAR